MTYLEDSTLVFEQKPADFAPAVEGAAIYVDVNGKLLLLHLSPQKEEAGAWGVPAGKLEKDEDPLLGAKRELYEETDIDLAEDQFQSLGELYIRKPEIDYVYHLFWVRLDAYPEVRLSLEHTAYLFALKKEAEKLPLMKGAWKILEYYERRLK